MTTIESAIALRDNITSVLTGVSNAAVKAAEDMNRLENTAIDELVSPTAVNRIDLLSKQTQLMEARWINQQNLVSKLSAEYDKAVRTFGRGSIEAEKLDAALFQAQYQENRLALQAVKTADSMAKQEQRAAATHAEIENQVSAAARVANEQTRFAGAAQQSHMRLLNVYAAINLIKTGIQKVTDMLTAADEYRDVNARLAMINDGLLSQRQLQESVFQAARNTRSAYTDIADTVNRIGWNASGLFQDTGSAVNFAELATKAMKTGSRSSSDNASALTHVLQGFESGGLSGENFKTLFRSASGQAFLRYVADGLDVSMGKLQTLADKGKLTAVSVAEALSRSTEQINNDFAQLPVTFGENMTRMRNAAMNWVDGLNQVGNPLDAINNKIEQFTIWMESAGGQSFFNNMTQGFAYAGSVIIPIIDNTAFQTQRLADLSNDPCNQAFFQSLAGYAQVAGMIINGVFTTVGTLSGFIINNWPLIEPIVLGIVGALVLWHGATLAMNVVQGIQNTLELASAGIKAAKNGITLAEASATAAATAAQWGLNASLLACPLTWIVLAIGAVIAIIVVLIRWVMKMWDTNDDFALGLLRTWNSVLGFFDNVPVFFARVWDAICTNFDTGKTMILWVMENIINGVISGVNFLIEQLNRIPGVSIEAVGKVSWAADSALTAEANRQTRAGNIAAMVAENDAKAAQREKDALAFIDNRAAKRAAEQAETEQKNTAEILDGLNGYDYSGININQGYGSDFNIGSVGKIKDAVDISSQDLKYLRDIAERDAINNFTHTTLVPKFNVTFGDVRETADVEKIKGRLTQMLYEDIAVMAEGVHS